MVLDMVPPIRVVKLADEHRLTAASDYCGVLEPLLEPLPADARERVRVLSSMCFGGVGGARDADAECY